MYIPFGYLPLMVSRSAVKKTPEAGHYLAFSCLDEVSFGLGEACVGWHHRISRVAAVNHATRKDAVYTSMTETLTAFRDVMAA